MTSYPAVAPWWRVVGVARRFAHGPVRDIDRGKDAENDGETKKALKHKTESRWGGRLAHRSGGWRPPQRSIHIVSWYSAERRDVHEPTVGPQGVRATAEAQRRKVALEDLAVVADLADDVAGEVSRETEADFGDNFVAVTVVDRQTEEAAMPESSLSARKRCSPT